MNSSILIIEDNPFLSELFEIAFTSQGFQVVCEASGLSGKNMALTWKPDFILLDIMMPDLDGLSVLQEIRAPLPDTKIICCSNLNQANFEPKALSLGADLILDKSQFTPLQIVNEVQKLK